MVLMEAKILLLVLRVVTLYPSLALKMEKYSLSETFVPTYKSTRYYNPQEQRRHLSRYENLKSHGLNICRNYEHIIMQFLNVLYRKRRAPIVYCTCTCLLHLLMRRRGEWARFATSSLTFPISSFHENLFQFPQKTIPPPSETDAVASLSHLLLLDT